MLIVEIIRHTPIWVFGLLAGMVAIGFRLSKTRELSLQRMVALPLIFIALSAYSLWNNLGPNAFGMFAWVLGVIVALPVAFALPHPKARRLTNDTASVSGSWAPLALMLGIFCTRYLVSAAVSVHPALREAAEFAIAAGLAYGFWSGIFLARALLMLRQVLTRNTLQAA